MGVTGDGERGWTRVLYPPRFADPDLTERARILYMMMLLTTGIVLVAGIFALLRLSARDLYAGLPAVVGYLAMQLAGLWATRRGWVRGVALAYCTGLWVALAVDQLVFGQHEVLLTASFINIALLAGFTLGARAAFYFGALTVVWMAATVWMHELGMMPASPWTSTPLDVAVAASGPLMVTAALMGYGLDRLHRAVTTAREMTRASEARARTGEVLGQLGRRVVELIDVDAFAREVLLAVPTLVEQSRAAIYRTAGRGLTRWRASEPGVGPASLDPDDLEGIGAGILIEIPGRREPQGAMLVRGADDRPIDPADQATLRTCAALLGAAFDRADTEAQLRQAQKMEAIGQLAGGVAHDFNNLLTSIIGSASLLLEDEEDEGDERADGPHGAMLRDIVRAGEHASLLTTQLLVFSRKERLHLAPLDLRESVRGLHGILARLLGPQVRLQAPAAGERIPVMADRRAIEQIVFNLCLNARDAVDQHGHIVIGTELVSDQDPPRAQLVVEDNGCGMDENIAARIFEPFFTTKRVGRGTGLGLSTVRGLVDELGGEITVESAPGEGARFTLRFPLAPDMRDARDVPVQAPGAPASAAPRARAGELLLLVEDHDLARRTLRATLESGGYAVVSARDGQEALTMLERLGEVSAVVTDVLMPRMSGDELVLAMRELGREIPTVMLSGYSGREQTDTRAPTGTLSLTKPVLAHDLLTAVRRVIDGSRPRASATDAARTQRRT